MADDIYPPDENTDIGSVRMLIPDVEQVDFAKQGVPSYMFSDKHIANLLRNARGGPRARIKRAAAAAMRAVGNSEGLIQKVIRTEDLQTDGAKLQQAFLTSARDMEREADKDDEYEEDSYGFAIVDFRPQPADCLPYALRGYPQPCSCTGACGCRASGAGVL